MRLYFKTAACSLASRIVLIELGIPFVPVRVDGPLTVEGEDFRTINPRGYVPALRLEDGRVLTENPAILQYLADLEPGRLAPRVGEWDRVRLQEALNFISSELHKAFSPFFSGETSEDRLAAARGVVGRRVGDVEAMLSDGRPWLLGEHRSVADAYLFVVLNWGNFIGLSLDPWPSVTAFMARMHALPAVRTALSQEGLAEAAE